MTPQGHQVGGKAHERKDADVISLFLIAALLLVLLTVTFAGVWGVVHYFNARRDARNPQPLAMRAVPSFPQPRLQSVPGKDLAHDMAAQEVEVNSYGWRDRSKKTVHIPVEQAMAALVKTGLPDVGAGKTRLQLMQARPQTNVQPQPPLVSPAPMGTP